jgi:hypothetical protein
MSLIQVTEVFAGPELASGVTIKSVAVTVLDSAGSSQVATLTGAETPTPWSAPFTVASGAGSVSSVSTDSTGAVGTPVVQAYTTTGTAAGPTTALSGTTVTITTP